MREPLPASVVAPAYIKGAAFADRFRFEAAEFAGNVALVLVRGERVAADVFSPNARKRNEITATPNSYATWSIEFADATEQIEWEVAGGTPAWFGFKTRKAALASIEAFRQEIYVSKCWEIRDEEWEKSS